MKKTLTIPIYDATIQLHVTKDLPKAAMNAGYDGEVGDSGGIVLHYPDYSRVYTIILNKDHLSPGIIAHEAYHLTKKIMNTFDLVDTKDNHETGAYLIGFIVDLITQSVKK